MKKKETKLISGVEYWRCKRRVSTTELKELIGCAGATAQAWKNPNRLLGMSDFSCVIAVADRLNVTIDQLFEVHSTAELEAGDRAQRETKYHPSSNCLSRYRIEKGLSYAQLGERMGLTRQRVQIACKQKTAPESGVKRICRYEQLTPAEFCTRYGGEAV